MVKRVIVLYYIFLYIVVVFHYFGLEFQNKNTLLVMDWFLYDNGVRHERVNSTCMWLLFVLIDSVSRLKLFVGE